MFKLIKKSEYFKSVFVLVSGTLIAQLISYALSPLISRLYSPTEMSFLTLFIRIISFVAVLSTARYEIAFPIPKRDEHAFSLYRSTFIFSIFLSFISFLGVFIIDIYDFQKENLDSILYYIPIGVFFVSFNSQGLNWAIRKKDFNTINLSKVLQSSINSVFCVIVGFLSFGIHGLIISFLISLLFANSPFFFVFFRINSKFSYKGRNKVMLKLYSEFPKINLPHVLLDLSKDLIVAFYLIYTFDKEVLGLYDFTYRMLRIPIGLVGVSISQVLFKNTVDLIAEKKGILKIVKKTIFILFSISIMPFAILFLFGEEIFSFVFGENWIKAGLYAEIMAPWLMINFILSPVSQIPTVLKQQRKFFQFSAISIFVLLFTLFLNDIFPDSTFNFQEILIFISVGQFICQTCILIWILKIANQSKFESYY